MKTLTITRQPSTDSGTFGDARTDDGKSWVSLELPWLDNQPDVSCIPTGTYDAELAFSPRFSKDLYHLAVEGRTNILIHSGNFAGNDGLQSDVEGCILLAMQQGILMNKYGHIQEAVLYSKYALENFLEWAAREPLKVVIQ